MAPELSAPPIARTGIGKPAGLSLLVLRGRDAERAVELKAAVQRLGARGEPVDVVLDGVVGQFVCPGRSGELRAEKDVFASPDELLVRLLELVERDVPEAVNDLVREDQRGRRRDARERRFTDCETHDPVGVIRGQRVADQQSGVDADHGELPVAERVHQPDEVVGEGARREM